MKNLLRGIIFTVAVASVPQIVVKAAAPVINMPPAPAETSQPAQGTGQPPFKASADAAANPDEPRGRRSGAEWQNPRHPRRLAQSQKPVRGVELRAGPLHAAGVDPIGQLLNRLGVTNSAPRYGP